MKLITETLNYARGLAKIWDKTTPSQLIFFVTSRCNARCRHCFYWRELNKNPEKELSLTEIKKISRSMGRLIWLFISGGEPFLRKDLPQICQAFYKNNHPKSIIIPTNGLQVEKIVKDTKKIAQNCPKAKVVIQVSIDDIGAKHDKIRGVKGNFAKIKELVPKLKSLQNDFPNLALQANVVFCAANQNHIKKILNHLHKEFAFDNICLSLIRGNPKEIGLEKIDFKKYQKTHQYLRQFNRFTHYSPLLSHLITKKEDFQVELFAWSRKQKKAAIPCLAGSQAVVLRPNGDLAVCELRQEVYGNLRKINYDFGKIWYSQKADQIRKKIKGCYCTQECVYTTNVFLNPGAWIKFLRYLTKSSNE